MIIWCSRKYFFLTALPGVIRFDDVGEDVIAVRITADMEMVVVATPEHLRRYGFPDTPKDLSSHPCIAYQLEEGSIYQWEFWENNKLMLHKPKGQ